MKKNLFPFIYTANLEFERRITFCMPLRCDHGGNSLCSALRGLPCTAIDRVADPTTCLMPEVAMICVGIRLRHLHRLRSMNLECSYERNGYLSLSAFSPSLFLSQSVQRLFNNPVLPPAVSQCSSCLFPLCDCRRSSKIVLRYYGPVHAWIPARWRSTRDSPSIFYATLTPVRACTCVFPSSAYNNDPLRARLGYRRESLTLFPRSAQNASIFA